MLWVATCGSDAAPRSATNGSPGIGCGVAASAPDQNVVTASMSAAGASMMTSRSMIRCMARP